MKQDFTQDELQAMAALIQRAPIKGNEATTVALLLNKLQRLTAPAPSNELPTPKVKKDKETKKNEEK